MKKNWQISKKIIAVMVLLVSFQIIAPSSINISTRVEAATVVKSPEGVAEEKGKWKGNSFIKASNGKKIVNQIRYVKNKKGTYSWEYFDKNGVWLGKNGAFFDFNLKTMNWYFYLNGKKVLSGKFSAGPKTPTGVYSVSWRCKQHTMPNKTVWKWGVGIGSTDYLIHSTMFNPNGKPSGESLGKRNGTNGCIRVETAIAKKIYDQMGKMNFREVKILIRKK